MFNNLLYCIVHTAAVSPPCMRTYEEREILEDRYPRMRSGTMNPKCASKRASKKSWSAQTSEMDLAKVNVHHIIPSINRQLNFQPPYTSSRPLCSLFLTTASLFAASIPSSQLLPTISPWFENPQDDFVSSTFCLFANYVFARTLDVGISRFYFWTVWSSRKMGYALRLTWMLLNDSHKFCGAQLVAALLGCFASYRSYWIPQNVYMSRITANTSSSLVKKIKQ